MLESAIPLFLDLGIAVQWQQVRIGAEHQGLDHELRRALSGYSGGWSSQQAAQWTVFNQLSAECFEEEYDVVVIHHTASVGLYEALGRRLGRKPPGVWVWHSHRDYHDALPEAWALIRQHAASFAAAAFDYRHFMRSDAPNRRNVVVPPGVDPFGARARPVALEVREAVLGQRGIDVERPVLAEIQFSSREESPTRLLDTFEMVKARRPDVQLVIVNMVSNEGGYFRELLEVVHSRGQKIGGIVVLTELDRVGNVELSALRQESTVLLHHGFPHGASLELLEEMWQSRPVVSGRSPVAEATLTNGKSGILADSPTEQAEAVLKLLNSPRAAQRLGSAAHDEVARRFLVTHHLAASLKLLQQLLRRRAPLVRAGLGDR